MFKIYQFLLNFFSPFLILYFYIRCLFGKDNLKNVKNHFGIANIKRPLGKLIWIHAASIGESTSALTFINHIKKQFPDLNILITTITVTSAKILYTKIKNIPHCYHQFSVVDKTSWIKKFLTHWNIDAAVFLESEIWPNMIDILHQKQIPIFLLNARLSDRSFKRWKLIKTFFSNTLRKIDCILAQSPLDMQRYSFFSPTNTKLIDNLKYANAILPCNSELLTKFREICRCKKVFVAVSTHEKEEEIILAAHKQLKKYGHNLSTIIIPRHITRIKKIRDIIKEYNLSFALRSEIDRYHTSNTKDIYIVDTFGEVGTFFQLADVCLVGGSFVPIGGHNIYEPVTFGKPVLHGPFMDNTREIRDFLHLHKLAFEVKDANEVAYVCNQLLSDNSLLENVANISKTITKNNALAEIDNIMQLHRFL